MMVKIGNFFFHYRNGLFPVIYAIAVFKSPSVIPDYRLAAEIGLAIALTGQLIRAVTIGLEYIVRGGRNRQVYAEKLVTGGIFNHCRNPLYVGNLLVMLGVGVASNSIWFLGLAMPFFIFAYCAIVAAEENFLRNKFGQDFDDYCARVNRWLPNLSGIGTTISGLQFNWRRLINAEYGSTFVWMLAVILVTLKNIWLHDDYQSSQTLVTVLWSLLGVVTLAYAIARYLKKSGRLEDRPFPAPAVAPDESVSSAGS